MRVHVVTSDVVVVIVVHRLRLPLPSDPHPIYSVRFGEGVIGVCLLSPILSGKWLVVCMFACIDYSLFLQ